MTDVGIQRKRLRRWTPGGRLLILAGLALGCGGPADESRSAEHEARREESIVPLYADLGDHHHRIRTEAELAQAYFDQGLRLLFGFNHPEAIRSFEEAARRDPECAMCYWGLAVAHGPNINAGMDSAAGVAAFAASRRALELAVAGDEGERGYASAIAARYADPPPSDRARLDSAYARAMGDLTAAHPDDADAAVYYAAALMNLSPWNYWTEDLQPRAGTPEILATLERVLKNRPDHPGACHYYIHAVEAAHPEKAIPCAERLPDLMPGAGHLVHMPAHVYLRVGRYADAVDRNIHAVHADEAYIADQRPRNEYTLAYYPHNYDFLSFAAAMAGRSAQAIEAARKTAEKADPEMMRAPGFGALQHYLVTPLRMYVRFGDWPRILASPPPPSDLLYPQGTWHYARGLALVRQESLDGASAELERLQEIAADPAMEEVTLWDLNAASALLAIAAEVLEGELLAARGEHDAAVRVLQSAVRREDVLVYDEPPDWHLPVRQVLGAILLEAGRQVEAEAAYRQDLEKYPENGWSLFGLARALEAQGREEEAARIRERFETAWATADVELTGSRF